MVKEDDLKKPFAVPSQTGLRSVWQWRPLASLTPAAVADILRRAALGDARDFLLAADDIREKDLHYRAVLQTRTLAAAGLPVAILPRDESRAAKRAASLVRDAVSDQQIGDLIAHLMDAVAKGYAVAEILWETRGGAWVPREIVPREAHWFTFDRDTGRLLRLVDGSVEGAEIPPYRMIVHAPPLASGIPLLGGVARSALWAWTFKSYALRDWARFAELFGQPIRIGKYHQGASPDDVAVLRRAVFELGSDAGAIIPQEMALELVEAGSKSASADLYHRLIEYLDKQVSKAVLGQTMTTDDGSSLAQARVHEHVRRELLEADARALEHTITRDLIAPIVRLNLGDDAPIPVFELVVDTPDDLSLAAEQIERLARAGVAIPQAWVRERFGIPEPKDGEQVIGGGSVELDGVQEKTQATFAINDELYQRQQHVTSRASVEQELEARVPELITERMVEETEAAWAEIMTEIRRMLDSANSLEEFREALLNAYGHLSTDRLADIMAVGFTAAELAGRFAVLNESDKSEVLEKNTRESFMASHAEIKIPDKLLAALERLAEPAPPPQVHVDVHVPEMPAPQVTVHVPELRVPEVRVDVHVPESPAPQVVVQPGQPIIVPTHPRKAIQTVERDEMGEIVKTVIEYEE